jgi:hypothetical protein
VFVEHFDFVEVPIPSSDPFLVHQKLLDLIEHFFLFPRVLVVLSLDFACQIVKTLVHVLFILQDKLGGDDIKIPVRKCD